MNGSNYRAIFIYSVPLGRWVSKLALKLIKIINESISMQVVRKYFLPHPLPLSIFGMERGRGEVGGKEWNTCSLVI
jgi:hypothetical protein